MMTRLMMPESTKYEYMMVGPCHPVLLASWAVKRITSRSGLNMLVYRSHRALQNFFMSDVTRWSLPEAQPVRHCLCLCLCLCL